MLGSILKSNYRIRVYALLKSITSILIFLATFSLCLPMEPTLDSIARYSWFNTFTAENWIFFLLSEPITFPFVLVTNSPLDFLLVFSFLTLIFNSFLLRVPLWAFSLFMLTPQGYLLTFNITPSFISFGVINYILLLGFRPSMFLLGVLSHLTTVLALINVLYSYKKNSLIIKVSAIGAILLISVLSLLLNRSLFLLYFFLYYCCCFNFIIFNW